MTKDEADEQLRKAIIDHAVAYDIADTDSELLNDYAVVAHWQKVEYRGKSGYTTQYSSESVPTHTAVGLFELGAHLARQDSEEDE